MQVRVCKEQVLFCSFLQLFHPDRGICISQASVFCINFSETGSIHATVRGGWGALKMENSCLVGKKITSMKLLFLGIEK